MKKYILCFSFVQLFLLINCQAQSSKKDDPQLKNKEMISMEENINAWRDFINCWSKDVAKKTGVRSDSLLTKKTDAPMENIDFLEKKLKVKLPQSYKDFLIASNGKFRFLNQLPEQNNFAFYSFEKIDTFANLSSKDLEIWLDTRKNIKISDKDYYIYGKKQLPPYFRAEYLAASLEVGRYWAGSEEFILLNPKIRTENEEMESWWLSYRNSGTIRYKSFADLMISFYYSDIYEDIYPTEDKIEKTCAKHLYKRYL